MPELPEVEHTRALLERALVGRRLVEVVLADDPIVIEEPKRFDALRGRRVVATRRHGKVAWIELDRAPHLVFHLGMTGAWRTPGVQPLMLESTPKEVDHAWPPRFAKISIATDQGVHLAMTDPRRFGRLFVRDDPRREPPVVDLGLDALTELPTAAAFAQALTGRRGTLKGLLLDQRFVAGIGNWIADEVLFQARLDPRRSVATLSLRERRTLHRALDHVVKTAVRSDARKDRFPKDWLFHQRWGKVPGRQTTHGHPIEHLVVAGRTTAWVPALQR